jgi:protein-S-isoprenylcysteine O-methyltransferase Ste14
MDSRSPRALIDTPPVWLAGLIALAWVQARHLPLLPAPGWLQPVGLGMVIGALVVLALALREFRRARTSVVPRERPAVLLTAGPYAYGRNPIYLADAMILTGLILRWDLASLPLVALFAAVVTRRFIRGEEALCRTAFGPVWETYAARVRRWL